jgi:hypothetical protein
MDRSSTNEERLVAVVLVEGRSKKLEVRLDEVVGGGAGGRIAATVAVVVDVDIGGEDDKWVFPKPISAIGAVGIGVVM